MNGTNDFWCMNYCSHLVGRHIVCLLFLITSPSLPLKGQIKQTVSITDSWDTLRYNTFKLKQCVNTGTKSVEFWNSKRDNVFDFWSIDRNVLTFKYFYSFLSTMQISLLLICSTKLQLGLSIRIKWKICLICYYLSRSRKVEFIV